MIDSTWAKSQYPLQEDVSRHRANEMYLLARKRRHWMTVAHLSLIDDNRSYAHVHWNEWQNERTRAYARTSRSTSLFSLRWTIVIFFCLHPFIGENICLISNCLQTPTKHAKKEKEIKKKMSKNKIFSNCKTHSIQLLFLVPAILFFRQKKKIREKTSKEWNLYYVSALLLLHLSQCRFVLSFEVKQKKRKKFP